MYQHTVHYYETDRMGVTHHSNYIRWMEEARVDFLEKIGFGYDKLEADGIVSPVVSVNCDYKKTTTFADVVTIEVEIEEFKGVKLKLHYLMTNAAGELVCEGHSVHCFLDAKGMPVRLNRTNPELFQVLSDAAVSKAITKESVM